MKFLVLFFTLVVSSFTFASETVRVLEDVIPHTANITTSSAKFYMDKASSLGYAQVDVSERYQVIHWMDHCISNGDPRFPRVICQRVPRVEERTRTIYQHTELIPNLVLEGDKVVFHGEESVECGTLGVSRVFKRPTLYLNGKCKLQSKIELDRAERKVIVDFKTTNK